MTTIADLKLAPFGVGPNVELRSVAHGCLEGSCLGILRMLESKHGFDQVLLLLVTYGQLRAAFEFEDWVPFNTDINHCFQGCRQKV